MFKIPLLTLILTLIVSTVHAEEVLIQGTVQSRCVITTDTPGVYGNPNAYTLTTTPADGGVPPIVRFDVTLADAYYAQITTPTSFSSSPSIGESLTWTGTTEVSTVSDSANMGTYETRASSGVSKY